MLGCPRHLAFEFTGLAVQLGMCGRRIVPLGRQCFQSTVASMGPRLVSPESSERSASDHLVAANTDSVRINQLLRHRSLRPQRRSADTVLDGPDGMNDPVTGLVDWTPASEQLSSDEDTEPVDPTLPVVDGFNVEVYADVSDSTELTLSPDGTLFSGNRGTTANCCDRNSSKLYWLVDVHTCTVYTS